MSWAAHEFEMYFIQKHVGTKASFLGVVIGTQLPDMVTKPFVYMAEDTAHFHRGWPGVGFTHSLVFGVLAAAVVLAITKSRGWTVGILLGYWAHVVTDIADTAGVMLFFPFSTEPLTISMWKHAAVEGRHGDAAAYYSSMGGVWDMFWLVVTLVFASRTLQASYFRDVVIPADPRVWGWLHRTFRLPEQALLLLYQGLMFYGVGRMITWFLYARFDAQTPFQPSWGGPDYITANDISDSGPLEVAIRTGIGCVLFAGFLWVFWRTLGRRLWRRGHDAPGVVRGRGLHAVFDLAGGREGNRSPSVVSSLHPMVPPSMTKPETAAEHPQPEEDQ